MPWQTFGQHMAECRREMYPWVGLGLRIREILGRSAVQIQFVCTYAFWSLLPILPTPHASSAPCGNPPAILCVNKSNVLRVCCFVSRQTMKTNKGTLRKNSLLSFINNGKIVWQLKNSFYNCYQLRLGFSLVWLRNKLITMYFSLEDLLCFCLSATSTWKQSQNWNWPGKCLCQQASTAPNRSEPSGAK